ncbi:transposase [Shimazuella sp. KC615]|uniref:Transposase n=1 Tax=Shimazuella alba TaxID=2690964 RepID=A0A6I4VXH5_9BACL|nr:transposase [Shimazuella alba]
MLKTGVAWMDMPKKYGSYVTCWRRLKEWEKVGIWERIWRKLLGMLQEKKAFELGSSVFGWIVCGSKARRDGNREYQDGKRNQSHGCS